MSLPPIVTVFGGGGFVGRYIVQRLARRGCRVQVAVRRPNDALHVQTSGVVGQVVLRQANVRDDASVRAALRGADVVINAVGILAENGKQSFDAVQAEGATRIARIAREEGVGRMVQISAIGADANGPSAYARSKAAGEAAVLEQFPDAAILRPSVIFGTEDTFFNRFAAMTRLSPILPVAGADTLFQPVWVDDVAAAAEQAALGAASGIYELGGPQQLSFRACLEMMLGIIERKRLILNLPTPVARLTARAAETVQWASGGLIAAPLTRDQIAQLGCDNVASGDTKGFADLGIAPTALEAILPDYLYCYRPQGQFTELTRSAEDLRG